MFECLKWWFSAFWLALFLGSHALGLSPMVKYSYDGNLKFITKKYNFNDWIRVRLRMGDTRKQAEKTWELAGYMNRIFLLEGQDIVAAKTSKKRNRDVEYPLLSAAALRTGDDSPAVEVTRDVVVID